MLFSVKVSTPTPSNFEPFSVKRMKLDQHFITDRSSFEFLWQFWEKLVILQGSKYQGLNTFVWCKSFFTHLKEKFYQNTILMEDNNSASESRKTPLLPRRFVFLKKRSRSCACHNFFSNTTQSILNLRNFPTKRVKYLPILLFWSEKLPWKFIQQIHTFYLSFSVSSIYGSPDSC